MIGFLKQLWSYLKRFLTAIRSLLLGVATAIRSVVTTLFEGPLGALERLIRKLLELLGRLVDWFRKVWLRIWQKAPSTPQDRHPTPGREIIPLWAGVATTLVWWIAPTRDALSLNTLRFVLAAIVTWIVAAAVVRLTLRQPKPKFLSRLLLDSHQRTGLIWFERATFLALAAGCVLSRTQPATLPPLAMLAIGYFVLLGSPYKHRALTDQLPPALEPDELDNAGPGADGTDSDDRGLETRHFSWQLELVDTQTLNVSVDIDPDTVQQLKSLNPKRPALGEYPDWTPWITDGRTADVLQAAARIRNETTRLSCTRFDEASAILGFAQSITYSLDEDTTGEVEYWRYPTETMFEETGDCEDSAILAVAVLRELGHDVLPLVTSNHAAIALPAPQGLPGTYVEHGGRRYFYCETTAAGWKIGELPPGIAPSDLIACPLRNN